MAKRRRLKYKLFSHNSELEEENNSIKGPFVDGSWVEEPKVVKATVKKYFEEKIKEEDVPLVRLDDVRFTKLEDHDNVTLTVEFTKEEVRQAIWECDGNKCQGLMVITSTSSRSVGV